MMKIETAKTDTFSMDYFKFGDGKRTLVILPGLSVQSVMLSAAAIKKAYEPLANDFTVFVFDRRRELPPVYSIEDMADDTASAIAAAGIGRACISGVSQGAMIAMKIAARRPESAEKLVLASAVKRVTDENSTVIEKWIELAEKGDAEKLYLSFGEAIYPQTVFECLRGSLSEAAKNVTREELSRFVALACAAKDFDASRELENIMCPTLVIGDKGDRIFGGGAARAIYERMKNNPDAELYEYNGYGHALYDTAPDFKERILRFLI
ncbi:MAG: alpha/beta hydrolase [Clostridia bacterium]|nr:alpha/beta hydrolase [Clostridia bacterium]